MCGSKHPLLHTPSLRSAQLVKHRKTLPPFTFKFTFHNIVFQHNVAISIISSIYVSVTIYHKNVSHSNLYSQDVSAYTAIIACPRYAKLFIALLLSTLKLKLLLKFNLNRSPY
jgi:hypothetical protein